MNNSKKNTKIKRSLTPAFTLIELMVVISIIALLSSIILAAVSTTKASASIAAGETFEDQMYEAYGANAVAIWNFDDGAGSPTAADISGNNNTLTIYSPSGAIENSTVFRGKSALSVISGSGNPASTTLATFSPANGSISFWLNLTSAGDQRGIFCSQTYFQFCIVDSNAPSNGPFIQVNWNGGANSLVTPIPASSVIGKWTNVAVSWSTSAGTINIYVNGNQATSSAYLTAPTVSPLSFCVGGDCHGTNITGYIDAMRVYSQSLQTGDVEKIYAEELPEHVSGPMLADARTRLK